jgi:phosphoglycerate dehydrogenase-like enzyme
MSIACNGASGVTDWVVTIPDPVFGQGLGELPRGVRIRLWDMTAAADDADAIDMVVVPYMGTGDWTPLLARLPGLRLVQTLTAGYDNIVPMLQPGVALANAVGVHDTSTAELAVGLTIASLRGFPGFVRAASRGEWTHRVRPSLADRRVLVLGFGGVGRAIAARLKPFDVDVTAVASRARMEPPEQVARHGVRQVRGIEDLDVLLPESDVVILTVPLTTATRRLVDAEFLRLMPDGAVLVNVSRGPVVDTTALLDELRTGRLMAALDVTDPEPLPPHHPLWTMEGALISPHVGGASTAFVPRAVRFLREQLLSVADGRRPSGIVVPSEWIDSLRGSENADSDSAFTSHGGESG